MCRLLGIVSARRAALSELLADDLEPFLALACDHVDGWGVAHTEATDVVSIAKEPERADHSSRFRPLVECCVTDAALLHLRLASPDLATVRGNTHPFGDHGAAFAHNGAFQPVDVLDARLGASALADLEGETDSERYYRAVRARMSEGVEPGRALLETAAEIRGAARSLVSLNALLLTPQALFAYTEHDPASEVIARRGEDFFDLHYRVEAHKVVVGSVGWPHPAPQWDRLPMRHVLRVDRRDLHTAVYAA